VGKTTSVGYKRADAHGQTKWTSRRSFLPKNVYYDNPVVVVQNNTKNHGAQWKYPSQSINNKSLVLVLHQGNTHQGPQHNKKESLVLVTTLVIFITRKDLMDSQQ
jgi:hypothetical protein